MRFSTRMPQRGLLAASVVALALAWLSTLVALVVRTYAPPEDPQLVMSYWQTGVTLLVTLPALIVFARWALRAERRMGPQLETVEDEEAAAAERPHQGLHGDDLPPPRW